eukprot:6792294-Pyramimonas_sp.AAC.1
MGPRDSFQPEGSRTRGWASTVSRHIWMCSRKDKSDERGWVMDLQTLEAHWAAGATACFHA